MPGPNGSSLILPSQPVAVELRRALPNGQGVAIAFPVHIDPRELGAQRIVGINELQLNEITIGLAQAQATIAMLSSQLAAVLVVLAEDTASLTCGDSSERVARARAMVAELAAGCTIATPQPSALDEIEPPR